MGLILGGTLTRKNEFLGGGLFQGVYLEMGDLFEDLRHIIIDCISAQLYCASFAHQNTVFKGRHQKAQVSHKNTI